METTGGGPSSQQCPILYTVSLAAGSPILRTLAQEACRRRGGQATTAVLRLCAHTNLGDQAGKGPGDGRGHDFAIMRHTVIDGAVECGLRAAKHGHVIVKTVEQRELTPNIDSDLGKFLQQRPVGASATSTTRRAALMPSSIAHGRTSSG